MGFYDRFELLELVRDDGVKTFKAREVATGRAVEAHVFVNPYAPLSVALLARIDQLAAPERDRRALRLNDELVGIHGACGSFAGAFTSTRGSRLCPQATCGHAIAPSDSTDAPTAPRTNRELPTTRYAPTRIHPYASFIVAQSELITTDLRPAWDRFAPRQSATRAATRWLRLPGARMFGD